MKTNIFLVSIKLIFILPFLLFYSCGKNNDFGEINTGGSDYIGGKGVFIINEGNFGDGNGSLSFYHFEKKEIENDIFYTVNNRPLGDVPQSMMIFGEKAFIVVNNSAKIEFIDLNNLKSISTIEGFMSPRFILPVGENKAYVSDFYDNSIKIINTALAEVTGEIFIGRSSEQMVKVGDFVYVAFWSNYSYPGLPNNRILVIDVENDKLIDSVEVVKEPNSMVVDKENKIWVLCSGGFSNEETPALIKIDPVELVITEKLLFPDNAMSPNCLIINGSKDTLYYLNGGIYRLPVGETNLPDEAFIKNNGKIFYSFDLDPATSEII